MATSKITPIIKKGTITVTTGGDGLAWLHPFGITPSNTIILMAYSSPFILEPFVSNGDWYIGVFNYGDHSYARNLTITITYYYV